MIQTKIYINNFKNNKTKIKKFLMEEILKKGPITPAGSVPRMSPIFLRTRFSAMAGGIESAGIWRALSPQLREFVISRVVMTPKST